jgi:hypothetical protein
MTSRLAARGVAAPERRSRKTCQALRAQGRSSERPRGYPMKQIAAAGALALALAGALIAARPSVAQTPAIPELGNPKVLIDYIEPRNEKLQNIYERLKKRQVLEEFRLFLTPLRLPTTLRVRTLQCGTVNAFYDPLEWSIKMCYELLQSFEEHAPKETTPEGFTRAEAVYGAYLSVLLHEAGHAVHDIFDLPVLGRWEDTADQISAFIALQFGTDVARTAIKGAAYVWYGGAFASRPTYWGQHSTPQQRVSNFLCLGYGGNPDAFKDLVEQGLISKARAANCGREYQQVKWAFEKTLLPHIDLDLLKLVRARPWLRPEELK